MIGRLPGVAGVSINYTTHRAQVRWDPARVQLSEILAAVARIGYRAFPYDRSAADAAHQRWSGKPRLGGCSSPASA